MVRRDPSLPYKVEFKWVWKPEVFRMGLWNAGFLVREQDMTYSDEPGNFDHIFIVFQSKHHGIRAMEAVQGFKLPNYKRTMRAYGAPRDIQMGDDADDRDPANRIPSVHEIRQSVIKAFQIEEGRSKPQTVTEADSVGRSLSN